MIFWIVILIAALLIILLALVGAVAVLSHNSGHRAAPTGLTWPVNLHLLRRPRPHERDEAHPGAHRRRP